MAVLGTTNPCPKKTGTGRLLWASLAYMDEFKPSLGYRLRPQLNNKKTNSAARVDKLGKKFKKSLDWTPELTSDLHHRHPHKQFSRVPPLCICKCCSMGVYLGMACAFVSAQGHSSEWWAAVYCLPLAEGARGFSILGREIPATLEPLYLHSPCLLWLPSELQPVMVLESPEKVFDLLSCFNN